MTKKHNFDKRKWTLILIALDAYAYQISNSYLEPLRSDQLEPFIELSEEVRELLGKA